MRDLRLFKLELTPETPVIEQPSQSPMRGWFGKKAFALIAVLAVIIILAALFVPQGAATIPLSVDYQVGEKMIYDTTMTASMQMGNSSLSGLLGSSTNNTNIDAQEIIEVLSFDGENYVLNHTTTMNLLNKPISISITQKMNKTGYSTFMLNNLGSTQEIPNNSISGGSYLSQLLSRPEVKVGDTITVPYPTYPTISGLETTGDLTITFHNIEELTTPAGTYRVFRIDMKSNNLTMKLTSNSIAGNMASEIDLNYQIYLEYGTLRQIKATMQQSTAIQSSILNSTMQLTMDMVLTEHIKP